MTRCKNPKCRKPLVQNRSGRPKQHCGKRCRDAAYRAGRAAAAPEAERYAHYTCRMAEDLARRADALLRAAHADDRAGGTPLHVLRLAEEVDRGLQDLRAAAVQLARARKVRPSGIAKAMAITTDRLRTRWSPPAIERRMHRRFTLGGHDGEGPLAAPRGARLPCAPRRREDTAGGPGAPPGQDPEARAVPLTRALATLHRASGRSLRDLARGTGVSASSVSRVLAGKRRPSWTLTRRLAEACQGDPADVLPLWRAANGLTAPPPAAPATPGTLREALRGLHLAAQRPEPAAIRRASHDLLTAEEITGVLDGRRLPAWTTVDRFVHALGGRPETYLPLWHAARVTSLGSPGPAVAGTARYPADAFG
ncbi:helix-turn-helix domain-containing protein [Streptomyces marincola]|uniref:HTH cro/C1-type domain-containing protein n=1 Tax=Streptomyces marincola TaxID=2878388 RepID=A0A1W7CSX6_9ACTN|nr:helix-turn-helix transcriptional regulator [Streptomyces marincola]ARQ67904.1 hypothetical protein CAG99_02785 [Streptomyces marincola]